MINKIKNFVKTELSGWSDKEKIFYCIIFLTVTTVSISANDSRIATLHAIFGILATILTGKGKISCYIIGTFGVLCYSYLAWKNALWGTLGLQILYYLPMEFIGIYLWKDHLKEDTKEVKKTKLSIKERWIISLGAIFVSLLLGIVLYFCNDKFPLPDAFVTILPVIAFYLTVKRCIEQWVVWSIVNAINIIMWLVILFQEGNYLATLLTWTIYFCFGIYFLFKWKKEIAEEKEVDAE
ncbi:nicotinamide mononucleotide transporter [bacterium]|nr:nicotinamide mononucleotide transporter [bacterium]